MADCRSCQEQRRCYECTTLTVLPGTDLTGLGPDEIQGYQQAMRDIRPDLVYLRGLGDYEAARDRFEQALNIIRFTPAQTAAIRPYFSSRE